MTGGVRERERAAFTRKDIGPISVKLCSNKVIYFGWGVVILGPGVAITRQTRC